MEKIIYGHAFEGKLRFSAVSMRSVVEEARLRHGLSPIATAALGRVLIAAALATPWIAEKETVTFVFDTKGQIGRIVAQGRGDFTVRGYVTNPSVEGSVKDGKFEISKVVVGGTLTVVRDLGLKTPFTSQVPIVSGEIAQDVAYYYTVSEQLPTAMVLGVLVGKNGVIAAGGYALQVLDRTIDEKVLDELESKVKELGGVTRYLKKGKGIEDVMYEILGERLGDYTTDKITFKCSCSRAKAFESLLVLDLRELQEMKEEGVAEVTCKWCGRRYIFDEGDLERAILQKRTASSAF